MNKFKVSVVVGTGLLLLSAAPVFATDVEVVGNGYDSENSVMVVDSSSTYVVQSNSAKVVNQVSVSGNSGDNEASGNTGGDTSINTGDVNSAVVVTNKLNENVASVDSCCDNGGSTDVLVKGNGADSENKVEVVDSDCTDVVQENSAVVKNGVEVLGNTGGNEANGETGDVEGWSDPSIKTGDVNSEVDIKNVANENVASVDGCCTEGGGDTVTVKGNGADSENKVKLFTFKKKSLTQLNFAFVGNWVGVAGNTGDNEANGNTGGDVSIKTGGLNSWVSLFTKLNKNLAL